MWHLTGQLVLAAVVSLLPITTAALDVCTDPQEILETMEGIDSIEEEVFYHTVESEEGEVTKGYARCSCKQWHEAEKGCWVTCTERNGWEQKNSCLPANCGPPPVIENADMITDEPEDGWWKPKNHAEYRCTDGYRMKGQLEQDTGTLLCDCESEPSL